MGLPGHRLDPVGLPPRGRLRTEVEGDAYVCMYICVRMYECINVYMCMCMYIYIYIYICIHIYIYIYVYMNTYIYIYIYILRRDPTACPCS